MAKKKTNRRAWGKVKQLPSGNYQASYVGPDAARYNAPMTFSTKLDADAWLATQRARIVGGTWTPATPTADAETQAERARNLGEYAAAWIGTRTSATGTPLRGTTRAEYERLLRGPLAQLTTLPLASITPSKVRDWYSATVKGGKLTQAARAYGLLRSIMQTAVIDGILSVNPCSIKGAQNARTGRESDLPTVVELGIIEATMPERFRAMVTLAAWGGLRYGELTELRRRDVINDEGTIVLDIQRAVTREPGEGFKVGPPKTKAGIREVALPPELTATILEHIEKHAQPGPDGLLFPARNGGHLAESTFTKSWYPARAAAGRDGDLSWHTLRAFAGTRFTQKGATMAEVMKRLGHTSTAAAMRYQRTTGRDAVLAARMMGDD